MKSIIALLKHTMNKPTGKNIPMPCPNCQRLHNAGEYEARQSDKDDMTAPGATVYCPPDIKCECGATLRYTVPLFKTTASGWLWRIIKPAGRAQLDKFIKDAADNAKAL